MRIKRYTKGRPAIVELLLDKGVLRRPPRQLLRDDLEYDQGIDIVYELKNITPAKFRAYSEALLLAAFTEAERYSEEKYKFAKLVVELNRTAKGRDSISPRRDYIAAKHTDSEIMVYGEEALGYKLPEEERRRPFLTNKVQEILAIPDTPSPGQYVQKQRPFRVVLMIISIRSGKRPVKEEDEEEREETKE